MFVDLRIEHFDSVSGGTGASQSYDDFIYSNSFYNNAEEFDFLSDIILDIRNTIDGWVDYFSPYSVTVELSAKWVKFGGGFEVFFGTDGQKTLYKDNVRIGNIEFVKGQLKDSTPSPSLNVGKESVGGSLTFENGGTVDYVIVPNRSAPISGSQ